MSVEIIGMFAAGTGGEQPGIAQVDIPQDGFILGIDWDAFALLNATAEFFKAELSFITASLFQTNDVRGRISSISAAINITTSGGTHSAIQKYVDIKELTVAGGERLFMHLSASGGVASDTRCNIHFEMRGGSTRRSARRR